MTSQSAASPRRFGLRSGPDSVWARPSVRAWVVFAVAMVMRVSFRATYLVNWDAVNFALGVESFDLEHHQPHPPGYLGYVLLGRLVRWVVGDVVVALTGVSVLSGALATMFMYILGRRILSERGALIAAVLFGTSPLVWYYSGVALTYIVEVALALPLVWLAIEARERRSFRVLLLATVLFSIMGALRQTSMVLFLGVWIYAWLPFSPRDRLRSAVALVTTSLVWLVPLVIMSGGPLAYLSLSSDLAQLTGGVTWFGAGPGVLQNFAIVATGLGLGLHVSLLAIPLSLFGNGRHRPRLRYRRLLAAWALPPLFVYLFLHSGQLGYVLVLLPVGIYWAAGVFDAWIGRTVRALAVAWMLVLVNVAGFTVLPELAYAAARDGRIPLPETVASPWLFERGIRQASLARSDAHWDALIGAVEAFDSETTAVLAEPRDGGSFRHLAFYVPDTLVYGVGTDRDGALGHLFTGIDRQTDYSVDKLSNASSHLDLPDEIDTLVIPDPQLREAFDELIDLRYHALEDGALMGVLEVPPGASLLFSGEDGPAVVVPDGVGALFTEDILRAEMADFR